MARKLILKWNIQTFIPSIGEELQSKEILEYIDPDLFVADQKVKEYWSIPERLIDINWLLDRKSLKTSQETQDQAFEEYLRAEYGLYRVVTTLGDWASVCSDKKYKSNPEAEQRAQIFWNENSELFTNYHNALLEEDASLSDDQLLILYELSKDIPSFVVSDARKNVLIDSANDFKKQVNKKTKKSRKNAVPSIASLDEQEKLQLIPLARNFVDKAIDYFGNKLWRKESSLLKKVKELIKRIANILSSEQIDDLEFRITQSENNPEALKNVFMDGLQDTADKICKLIQDQSPNTTGNKNFITFMNEKIDRTIDQLRLRDGVAPQFDKYVQDRSRCVALLELHEEQNLQRKILAFSGFMDCDDAEVIGKMQISQNSNNKDIVCTFQSIAKHLGASLAVLSSDAVDKIYRYLPTIDCTLKPYGPLRLELQLETSSEKLRTLKGQYSCCERKILIEYGNLKHKGKITADLWVKFPPCQNCFGALQQWVKAENVQLKLEYPSMPNSFRNATNP